MSKSKDIILKVLKPLVDNKIIGNDELERIKKAFRPEVKQPAKPKPESFKTVKEASELLRADRKTIYNWMKEGKLDFCRLTRKKVLIYEDSLLDFLEKHKNKYDIV